MRLPARLPARPAPPSADCPYKHSLEAIKECNMYKLGFCIYGPAVSSEQRGSTRIGNTHILFRLRAVCSAC